MAREYPAHPVVGVGAVIVRGAHGLIVKRGHEPRKGEWSLPGGLLNLGESLTDAVRREVKEETGLRASVTLTISASPVVRGRLMSAILQAVLPASRRRMAAV